MGFHLCWAVHLQGRWEAQEEQPPAPLSHAALPCTALLTGLLVWNWYPCSFWTDLENNASLIFPLPSGDVGPRPAVESGVSIAVEKISRYEQQLIELSSHLWDHLFPYMLDCPSARQMGNTVGAAACSSFLCLPPLHSPAHRVSGLELVSLASVVSVYQQGTVDKATAIWWCGASTCSGVRSQPSSGKALGHKHQ
ncbi:uncharacterized protein LOC109367120 isoform X2 [Meleagris gallopavo]|uniref:uncharacterized protein LOC109367120 isoform X2 n=1 Tax=Meleagris gallopavo TaxID=9103 RepID=UPI0012ABB558|nr:uncharacterized protein LOC109367120 isoform X2 [Meleagris gallopavo]